MTIEVLIPLWRRWRAGWTSLALVLPRLRSVDQSVRGCSAHGRRAGLPASDPGHATNGADLKNARDGITYAQAQTLLDGVITMREKTLDALAADIEGSRLDASLFAARYPSAYVDKVRQLAARGTYEDNPCAAYFARDFLKAIDRELNEGKVTLDEDKLRETVKDLEAAGATLKTPPGPPRDFAGAERTARVCEEVGYRK